MEHEVTILQDLVVILIATIAILPLCRALRLPSLVGFVGAGVLIGPYGLQLIREVNNVRTLAEIGIVLLLFTIGLEFPLHRLRQMSRIMFLGGGLQVIGTIAVGAAIVGLLGLPLPQAMLFGFLISLSSTAIVMKVLSDSRETNSPHGKIAVGLLVFQDLSFVPMMLLLPVLTGTGQEGTAETLKQLAVALVSIAAIIAGGKYLIPFLMRQIVRLHSRDVFVLGVILVSLGSAYLTSLAGLSLALGAFVAGLVLAESEFHHQIFADIIPLRDLLGSFFFISIGMLLDIGRAIESPGVLASATAALICIKLVIVVAVVSLLQFPIRTALLAGMALAQVGEFSFILGRTGYEAGLIDIGLYQGFLATTIMTMVATPFLIQYGWPAVTHLLRGMRVSQAEEDAAKPPGIETLTGHVVIVGYGINGKNLATVLREAGIRYVILDLDGERVRRARDSGEPAVYGDGTRRQILTQINIEKARMLVVAFSDPESTRLIVRTARSMSKGVRIVVRTHYLGEMEELYNAGADEVIPEEFETSIEIFTRVLREYHIPRNVIAAQVDLLRRSHYGMMRGLRLPDATFSQLEKILAAGTTDTFLVLDGSRANGATLGELDIRGKTGATVLAIVRNEQPTTNPSRDFRIEAGDILVLIGTHAEVDRAFEELEGRIQES